MDIPEDIEAAAYTAVAKMSVTIVTDHDLDIVALAILAERRRCAEVARAMAPDRQFDEDGDEVTWDEWQAGKRQACLEVANSIMRGDK